jgi:hypothetical protein
MQKVTPVAVLFIAACASSTGASAQTTYRCGNSYSQQPCAGGVVLDPRDRRDSSQKVQSDTATLRDARAAEARQAERLAQEQKDLLANTPRSPATQLAATHTREVGGARQPRLHKNKRQAEYFTAQVPGEKKKQKPRKKKPAET